ncbi:hypothetical protein [Nonomuraea sp. NPDC005650]|uniref:hypothetical protein n=1 Tax=Nonomuraea sp. NPDC005650 TaxID=3157045 RepID=UPI0033AA69E8
MRLANILRKAAFVGATGTALTILLATSASAISWNSSAPSNASSVSTPAYDDVRIGATGPNDGTLQVRKGKYNGKWYVWGRVASPSSKLNSGYELQLTVAGIGCKLGSGTKIKDINTTTYTAAAPLDSSCQYTGRIVKTSSGYTLGIATYYA